MSVWHRISNKQIAELIGDCSVCGPSVKLKRKSDNRLACWTSASRWNAKSPERRRREELKREYDLTPTDADAMLAAQGGVCAICKTDEPGGRHKVFHVDHDHATGEVRGLLCHGCNVGIGHLKDSIEVMYAAIDYLTGAKERKAA